MIKSPQGGEPTAVVRGADGGPRRPPRPKAPERLSPMSSCASRRRARRRSWHGAVTIIDGSTGKRQEAPLRSGGGRQAKRRRYAAAQADPSRSHSKGRRRWHAVVRCLCGGAPDREGNRCAAHRHRSDRAWHRHQNHRDARSRKLPGAVTLAFVPYGADIEASRTKAREDGHEVLLQVPMEPVNIRTMIRVRRPC